MPIKHKLIVIINYLTRVMIEDPEIKDDLVENLVDRAKFKQ